MDAKTSVVNLTCNANVMLSIKPLIAYILEFKKRLILH